MKILFTPSTPINSRQNISKTTANRDFFISRNPAILLNESRDTVSFSGKSIMAKHPDINLEIKKLLRQFDELLQSGGDISIEERWEQAYDRVLKHQQYLISKMEELEREVEFHMKKSDKFNPTYQMELRTLFDKVKRLKKQCDYTVEIQYPTVEEIKMDYKLLNLFKTSVINEHFDLKKVFLNYYKDLINIRTVEELGEKFPKLIPPQKPENVIADKIINTLTRDYYEKLNTLLQQGESEKASQLLYQTIINTHNLPILQKNNIDLDKYDEKVALAFSKKILDKCTKIIETDTLNSIPVVRKSKPIDISDMDLKLLKVDYDDYTLTIFKEMYLNGKRFKDIKYNDGNTEIDLSKIKENSYKIDKVQEKIKKFISIANAIKEHQRDYDKFTAEELKERISYYGDKLGDDDTLLEKMIDFIHCRFHEDDKSMLIKFLRELDFVWDGEKTVQEAVESIKKQDIRPIGTEKLNTVERKKAIEQKRRENKIHLQLSRAQETFDNTINLLYQNNMNYAAEICSKYRPKDLSPEALHDAEFIQKLISQYKQSGKDIITNKSVLETKLNRWDMYTNLVKSKENPKLLKAAQNFVRKEHNDVDIDTAGKYLLNHAIVTDFPKGVEYYKKPEILKKIMEYCGDNKEEAIKYLCKYDNYADMSKEEKSSLQKSLTLFDIKDPLDKAIIKSIIENDYINSDTVTYIRFNDKTINTIPATISSKAKQEIINYYKFPECINIFKAFEEALGTRATNRGAAGIKRILGDKSLYQFELKIIGYPDRLMAKDDKLIFDTFSKQGLH